MHFYRVIICVNIYIHLHYKTGERGGLCQLWSAPFYQEGKILVRSPSHTSHGLELGRMTTVAGREAGRVSIVSPHLTLLIGSDNSVEMTYNETSFPIGSFIETRGRFLWHLMSVITQWH